MKIVNAKELLQQEEAMNKRALEFAGWLDRNKKKYKEIVLLDVLLDIFLKEKFASEIKK